MSPDALLWHSIALFVLLGVCYYAISDIMLVGFSRFVVFGCVPLGLWFGSMWLCVRPKAYPRLQGFLEVALGWPVYLFVNARDVLFGRSDRE